MANKAKSPRPDSNPQIPVIREYQLVYNLKYPVEELVVEKAGETDTITLLSLFTASFVHVRRDEFFRYYGIPNQKGDPLFMDIHEHSWLLMRTYYIDLYKSNGKNENKRTLKLSVPVLTARLLVSIFYADKISSSYSKEEISKAKEFIRINNLVSIVSIETPIKDYVRCIFI